MAENPFDHSKEDETARPRIRQRSELDLGSVPTGDAARLSALEKPLGPLPDKYDQNIAEQNKGLPPAVVGAIRPYEEGGRPGRAPHDHISGRPDWPGYQGIKPYRPPIGPQVEPTDELNYPPDNLEIIVPETDRKRELTDPSSGTWQSPGSLPGDPTPQPISAAPRRIRIINRCIIS